ncbi:MAG TPA: large conductance mechanosensitive channel protein MscL [Gemmatales bacterium]|nr:large conductance mechanosensitive channel protein MscL [Gemmatales bacterium]
MLDKIKSIGTGSAGKAFSLFDEFKAFAFKGNVIDMAVGVVIGAAFAKIIDSLVKCIIMPLFAAMLPGTEGVKGLKRNLNGSDILYGEFLADVITFLLIALALFLFVVKFLGLIMKKKKAEAVTPPPPTKDQELLMEIRDLLKAQAKA